MTTTQSGPQDVHELYDYVSRNFQFNAYGNLAASYLSPFAVITDGHDIIIHLDEEGEWQLGFSFNIPRPSHIRFKPSPYNFRFALEQGIYKGIIKLFPKILIKKTNKAVGHVIKDIVSFSDYKFLQDAIEVSPSFSAIYGPQRTMVHLPCLVKLTNAGTIAMPFSEQEITVTTIPYEEISDLDIIKPNEPIDSINKIIFAMFMNNQISMPDKDNESLWEYP
jgi:hypothetical protein